VRCFLIAPLVEFKSCHARSPGFDLVDLAIIYEQSREPKAAKETATRILVLACSCENERLSGPADPEGQKRGLKRRRYRAP
jgi:hypothetical protein